MFPTDKHLVPKIAVLSLTTALLIGFSAGITFEEPASNAVVSGDAPINISDGDSSGNYSVYYKKSGGSWSDAVTNPSSPIDDGGTFTTFTWDTSSFSGGDFKLNVTNFTQSSETIDLTVDNNAPSASLSSPSTWTNSDSPTVEVSGSDSTSSVVNVTFSILDTSGNIVNNGNTCTGSSTCSTSPSDLSDGKYKVNYTVFDEGENKGSGNLTFNVDTTASFSVSPDFSQGPGPVKWSSDFTLDFSIEGNSESEDVTVKCIDGDGDTIDSSTGSGTSFSCDIPDDYGGSTVDLSVEVCDKAGNCVTSDSESFIFDAGPPSVVSSNIPGSVVNSDFMVEFSATDDASGVDSLEYFYDDSSVSTGSGTSVELNGSDSEFIASVDSLQKGSHTIYLRVRDNAGRWSSASSLDFDYRPNAEPEITMDSASGITVTAGESTGFQVTVRNTGDIFIKSTEITAAVEGVFSQTEKVKELKPSNSSTVSFTIDTTKDDLGGYDLNLSATYPATSKTIDLVVEATQQQQSNLNSRLSKYESRLQKLQTKINNKEGDLPKDLQSRLESNFSAFKKRVERAQTAKRNGEYYKVSSALEGIDSDYQAAQSSFQNVKKMDNRRDTRRWIMIGGGLLFLLMMAGGGIYYFETDEIDFDISGGDLTLHGIKDGFNSLLSKGGEEAEQFEWDGFKE